MAGTGADFNAAALRRSGGVMETEKLAKPPPSRAGTPEAEAAISKEQGSVYKMLLSSKHTEEEPISEAAELLLIHQLKLICVPKGSLRNCYADVVSQLQKLQILSKEATKMSDEEFKRKFRHCFREEILESEGKPASAFWRGNAQCRFEADFECVIRIGEGSFGTVYKCKSKLDKQTYAVKIVDILEGSKKYEAKILREVQVLSRISHENVVRYFGAWIEVIEDTITPENSPEGGPKAPLPLQLVFPGKSAPKREAVPATPGSVPRVQKSGPATTPVPKQVVRKKLYIQMAYVPHSLKDYLSDEDLYKTLDKLQVIKGLVEALRHIHEHGVVHRDAAPKNILLDADFKVKLVDFGLSKVLANRTGANDTTPIGTPLYMAPETKLSLGRITTKADMYALGVIIAEVWKYRDNQRMVRKKLGQGELPDDLPPKVAALVKRLMVANPGNRPDHREVLKELKSLEHDGAAACVPPEKASSRPSSAGPQRRSGSHSSSRGRSKLSDVKNLMRV